MIEEKMEEENEEEIGEQNISLEEKP